MCSVLFVVVVFGNGTFMKKKKKCNANDLDSCAVTIVVAELLNGHCSDSLLTAKSQQQTVQPGQRTFLQYCW